MGARPRPASSDGARAAGGEQGLASGGAPALGHRSGSFGTVPEERKRSRVRQSGVQESPKRLARKQNLLRGT